MAATTPLLVTYEESLLREESSLEEVVNGELLIMPPPIFPHGDLLQYLNHLLQNVDRGRFRVLQDVGYLIEEKPRLRYRIPDLAVAELEAVRQFRRVRNVGDPYARFAPVAVIEVLSPSNRKGSTAQLIRDYQDLGVEEILFLDPRTLTATWNGVNVQERSVDILGGSIDLDRCWQVFEQGE